MACVSKNEALKLKALDRLDQLEQLHQLCARMRSDDMASLERFCGLFE